MPRAARGVVSGSRREGQRGKVDRLLEASRSPVVVGLGRDEEGGAARGRLHFQARPAPHPVPAALG